MGGRPTKKGTKGTAIAFMSRNAALKKLQLKLPDFRRLCILKGVYPREPRHKRKITGSTANKTYYLAKDIAFLSHDPVLHKFREFKVFIKRLKNAIGRKDYDVAERIRLQKPVYTLDHIIRERYPSFTDALRDLDDALCMVFLFSKMPRTNRIRSEVVSRCSRLCNEFESYIIRTQSLRKVFISIKGIYYQAEVMGCNLTWIVPHQFSVRIPHDVDFRIMLTFLEFYMTLMGFVNFRLYHSINLKYPPRLDASRDDDAAGMNALILEPASIAAAASEGNSETDKHLDAALQGGEDDEIQKKQRQQSKQRIASLGKALAKAQEADEKNSGSKLSSSSEQLDDAAIDESFATDDNGEDAKAIAEQIKLHKEMSAFKHLFANYRFFISREVPRASVEFVIKSFGGAASWDATVAGGASYPESDESITHQIVDRPILANKIKGRKYVQPQWLFDCVNAHRLLDTALYAPGVVLPPHLSPFVVAGELDYVPNAEENAMALQHKSNGKKGTTDENDEEEEEAAEDESDEEVIDEDDDDDEDQEEDEEEDEDEDDLVRHEITKKFSQKRSHEDDDEDLDDETVYQRELEAETKGMSFSKKGKLSSKQPAKFSKINQDNEENERTELAKIMMPRKDQRVYHKLMKEKEEKQAQADALRQKKGSISKAVHTKPIPENVSEVTKRPTGAKYQMQQRQQQKPGAKGKKQNRRD